MSVWFSKLPPGWEEAPLKSRLARNDGGVWGADPDGEGDTLVLRSTEQRVDGSWAIEDPAARKLAPAEADAARLEVGDLVVTKSSGSELHIGKTSLVTSEVAALRACYSNFMQRLRVDARTDPRFVHYWMNNELCREQFAFLSNTTSGLANLNGTVLGTARLAFPARTEQERIANFLDEQTARIDALIAEKERLTERLTELQHSELGHLAIGTLSGRPMKLTGHSGLPHIPEGWTLSRLKWVSSLLRDGTHTPPPRVDEGVPLLSVRNVQDGQFAFLPDDSLISEEDFRELNRSFDVRQNDVLLAVVGATMGKVAVVGDMGRPFHVQRSLAVIRPRLDRTLPELLAAQLRADYFQQLLWQNTGFSAQPGIYLGALADFPIPLPPASERAALVEKIRARQGHLENLVAHVREHVDRLREYRSSLISAAVTGQLDLGSYGAKAA